MSPGTVVVIPARFASTRFPGKPLAAIAGKPMIAHVVARARAAGAARVLVATDDERIALAAEAAGAEARLTPAALASGTDRVAYVVRDMSEADVILNVQGDEPLVDPLSLQLLAELFDDPATQMATLRVPLRGWDEYENPHVVKVVVDDRGQALYFSRAPIPYTASGEGRIPAHKHIGIYGYRRATLLALAELPPHPLELVERLEQLRALAHGIRIRVADAFSDSIGVDRPEDVARVEAQMARH